MIQRLYKMYPPTHLGFTALRAPCRCLMPQSNKMKWEESTVRRVPGISRCPMACPYSLHSLTSLDQKTQHMGTEVCFNTSKLLGFRLWFVEHCPTALWSRSHNRQGGSLTKLSFLFSPRFIKPQRTDEDETVCIHVYIHMCQKFQGTA